ncbi:transposable element Tc3 transposase [Trichonephila clavipes]|nr:transposable element Tc3 transposase [Trichonephila clavipes]
MMTQRRQLDMFTKRRIVGMLESSRSQIEVSRFLNVDQYMISRLWQRFQRTGDVTQPPVSGRPRVTYLSMGEWANVMFSDESQFSLSSDSRRVTIWRERGTRFEPGNITERHHFPSRGVMVLAGIMMDGRTDLHFFDTGSVITQRYRDVALEPYVRLFRGAVSPDFIFMDDNAPCHRAVLIDNFLETEIILHMSWPANSPDLNTIEHVWDTLERQIAALSHPPSSIAELKRALQESWNRLSPQLIHHPIASMVNRCSACQAVRGDHTPY